MRISRVAAALIAAPIIGGATYVLVLAQQSKPWPRGPRQEDLFTTFLGSSVAALLFAVVVLLPLAVLVRRNGNFRLMVSTAGIVAWFGVTVAAFVLMGEGPSIAAFTGIQLLVLGGPLVVVFAAILGKGPHA